MNASKYKSVWQQNQKNEAFWNEVLVGRKIHGLEFDNNGLTALILDSTERLLLVNGGPDGKTATIAIKD